jgi:hypothetical protein
MNEKIKGENLGGVMVMPQEWGRSPNQALAQGGGHLFQEHPTQEGYYLA